MKKITIGITDCSKFINYEKWFTQDPSIEVIKLSWKDKNYEDLKRCDGIVLSGGEDVHPKFYNKPENLPMLDPKDIIEDRDEFELQVIEETQKMNLPVLGICRGLQIANVYFKGTLIPDLPSVGKDKHAKDEGYDQRHEVSVVPGTILSKAVISSQGEVNSAHHQAADKLGEGLIVNSNSSNGVIEGLERKDPQGKPFLLLVQWHPERMKDADSTFSKNIREIFISEVRKLTGK
ncbi:MAG: gamma-glutamyl-gamma-aminobutyrate hydrolase family protein [Cytophagaceae bacterium]